MKLVNKIVFSAIAAALLFGTLSCSKKSANSEKKVKIGIAKIVQHVALDSVEQGIVDYLKDNGIDAEYDLQNANGDVNTAAQIALKYKDENVDVAVGIATPVALALANSIKDIPVVFGTITDPLGAGLVTTLDHGEGNVTGMSDAIPTEQHIALFKEIAGIKTLGYIYTSSEANSVSSLELVKNACQKLGLNLVTQSIANSSEVKQAAETIVNRVDGIYLTTDNTVFSALSSLIQVFEKAKKPIFSGDVTGAMNGGCVIASGFNYYKAGRATGEMVLQILNGKKPSELPVRFMTEPEDFDLLFDLDSAKNCGIEIPKKYLDTASMIFENGKLIQK
ncbi:putative ABC transport system substrate-binding protein [Treponema berlinense]|uniref:Putative ABC transport system substrate-binding protein n=1 Tax=Treponema berlinense TaxID=225004 RepID=A0A1T4N7X8_9SPIR|nr:MULTISPECIES: ABC transporter substrate-binding protein [Treponema]MBQ9102963.1 ABC transporter substrate-binding protein [Treponema sp.]SJZ75235.1 putative ABC transport system substrate-binding protein [Treponema berlinense]